MFNVTFSKYMVEDASKDESIASLLIQAYSDTLKKYHGWLLQKVFSVRRILIVVLCHSVMIVRTKICFKTLNIKILMALINFRPGPILRHTDQHCSITSNWVKK